jgi:hypothetical protein
MPRHPLRKRRHRHDHGSDSDSSLSTTSSTSSSSSSILPAGELFEDMEFAFGFHLDTSEMPLPSTFRRMGEKEKRKYEVGEATGQFREWEKQEFRYLGVPLHPQMKRRIFRIPNMRSMKRIFFLLIVKLMVVYAIFMFAKRERTCAYSFTDEGMSSSCS